MVVGLCELHGLEVGEAGQENEEAAVEFEWVGKEREGEDANRLLDEERFEEIGPEESSYSCFRRIVLSVQICIKNLMKYVF